MNAYDPDDALRAMRELMASRRRPPLWRFALVWLARRLTWIVARRGHCE
jgi:hypothetical protein